MALREEEWAAEAPDDWLWARLAGGDPEALTTLYRRHADVAHAVARRITGASDSADDVVQRAFLKLWGSPGCFAPRRGAFRPWFLRTVSNLAIDDWRRSRARARVHTRAGAQVHVVGGAADETFEAVAGRMAAGALAGALRGLPVEQRQVIELAYIEGCTLKEIAARLRTPLTTVKGRMRLGLRRLRRHLAAPEPRSPAEGFRGRL